MNTINFIMWRLPNIPMFMKSEYTKQEATKPSKKKYHSLQRSSTSVRTITHPDLFQAWDSMFPNFRCCFRQSVEINFRVLPTTHYRDHRQFGVLAACIATLFLQKHFTQQVAGKPTTNLCVQSIYRLAKVFLCSTSTCWVDKAKSGQWSFVGVRWWSTATFTGASPCERPSKATPGRTRRVHFYSRM